MTTIQVPTRFTEAEVATLDELVRDGVAESRSQAVRVAVDRLADAHRRRKIGEEIADSYRSVPQSPALDRLARANALALVDEEPW